MVLRAKGEWNGSDIERDRRMNINIIAVERHSYPICLTFCFACLCHAKLIV